MLSQAQASYHWVDVGGYTLVQREELNHKHHLGSEVMSLAFSMGIWEPGRNLSSTVNSVLQYS